MRGIPSRRKKLPKVSPEVTKQVAEQNKPQTSQEGIKEVEIPVHLLQAGWKRAEGDKLPKAVYGLVKVSSNYIAVRIEAKEDGSALVLDLPENLKAIAVDRIIDMMMLESQ